MAEQFLSIHRFPPRLEQLLHWLAGAIKGTRKNGSLANVFVNGELQHASYTIKID
jgi:hypothetical protein